MNKAGLFLQSFGLGIMLFASYNTVYWIAFILICLGLISFAIGD
jgi:hypothetical protein